MNEEILKIIFQSFLIPKSKLEMESLKKVKVSTNTQVEVLNYFKFDHPTYKIYIKLRQS